MRASLLGQILLPPAQSEDASVERQRQTAIAHGGIAASAALFDVLLYFLLRHDPTLRQGAVRLFAEVAIPLLVTSALLNWLARRRPHRLSRAVQVVCLACEAGAMMMWIQLTGSVSSYFLIMAILLILSYRIGYSYWLGLACLLFVIGFHSMAFALEELRVIPPASLFLDDPGAIYHSAAFRLTAFSSITWCYAISFFMANYLTEALKRKDRELVHIRRDLDRAVEQAQIGRLSGQVLAKRYELGELLGRGGMGEVYQAKRLSDGRELAVKVLLADVSDEPTVRERFQREAEAIARLPPEFVAGFVEMCRSDEGHDMLVMELLQGEDLGAVLRRRGRLRGDELLPIAGGIARALAAAHERGIVHRDLKPPNVFVGRDGAIKLLDFGIARLMEGEAHKALTMTSVILGTPGYLAPEQARGKPDEVGPHTDLFAFGAIVYRALTGRNPFPSRNPVAAAYEALCHHPAAVSTLEPELHADVDAVLALAMAKAIADRYSDPAVFVRDLGQALDGKLPDEVRARGRALVEHAPTAEATLATVAGRSR